MVTMHVTRGYGILEEFLAKKRAKMANKLIPSIHRKGRIVDVGCGTFPFFLINTEFAEKYALDKVIRYDNRNFQEHNIIFINHNIETKNKLPFDSEYFDVITMLAVFEHIEPNLLPFVLKEIYRVLKYGGIYIMTTPAFWTHGLL